MLQGTWKPHFYWVSGWGRALLEGYNALTTGSIEHRCLPANRRSPEGRLFQPRACDLRGILHEA